MIESDIWGQARGDTISWKKSSFACELDGVEVIVTELPDGTNILFMREESLILFEK